MNNNHLSHTNLNNAKCDTNFDVQVYAHSFTVFNHLIQIFFSNSIDIFRTVLERHGSINHANQEASASVVCRHDKVTVSC